MLANNEVELAAGIFKNRMNVALASECELSTLFTDTYIRVMRRGHPLTRGELTKALYLGAKHINRSKTEDAVLFTVNDEPVVKNLDFYREEQG